MMITPALDLITPTLDLLSAAVLVFIVIVGYRALRAFRQSKQAVTESASLLEVIVNALTSRIGASESLVTDLQASVESISARNVELNGEQYHMQTRYMQVLEHLQAILSNDRRIILELEQLKARLTSIQQKRGGIGRASRQVEGTPLPMPSGDVLGRLTPTESHILEVLAREGAKGAPELGRRMRKSREHMARLMKKLYLEGYVDRESNHAPFRYRLNEKVQPLVEPEEKSVTLEAPEKA